MKKFVLVEVCFYSFIYLFIFDWMHLSCYSVDAGNVILFFQVFVNRKRLTAKANA